MKARWLWTVLAFCALSAGSLAAKGAPPETILLGTVGTLAIVAVAALVVWGFDGPTLPPKE